MDNDMDAARVRQDELRDKANAAYLPPVGYRKKGLMVDLSDLQRLQAALEAAPALTLNPALRLCDRETGNPHAPGYASPEIEANRSLRHELRKRKI